MRPRLVFMGTPDFGVPTLRHLAVQGFPIALVITQPDKPCGRGYAETQSSVKRVSQELGLPVFQPDHVNDPEPLRILSENHPDVIVVAAFGQILKPALLALPRWGCINLHASLLPRYRGAAPIQWAIARGETETGVTVQKRGERVDAGAALAQRTLAIGPDETAPELFNRLADLGAPAVVEALERLQSSDGRAGIPQDETQATDAPRLARADGRIDWTWPGSDIHNRVRGFNAWSSTHAFARGEMLKVLATRRSDEPAQDGAARGTVLRTDPEFGWLAAAGGGTTVWVQRVQCPNSKSMTAQAYACGYRFGTGDRLESRQ